MSDIAAPAVKTEPRTVSIAKLRDNQIVGKSDMRRLVGELTPVLAKSLPVALKAAVDRVGASLVVEMGRSERVANSSAMSLLGVLIQSAQLGLELGGPLGQCWAVPYWNSKLKVNEAQWQCGYRGYIALAYRAAPEKSFDAHPVFEADEFDIGLGSEPFVKHRPPLRGERGPLVGAYALLMTPGKPADKVEWMTVEELEKHRDRFAKKDKNGEFSFAWTSGYDMFRKIPLRRLGKRVPLSAEIMTASTLDEMGDDDVGQNLGALVGSVVDAIDLPSPKAQEVGELLGAKSEQLGADDIPR